MKKEDASWRFCVDYGALYALTIKNCFPVPMVDELLDELNDAVVCSELDLRSEYHQIRMHSDDTYKMAFCIHDGHY